MRDQEHQPEPTLIKTPVGSAITAVIGLIVAAISLLLFVLDLLVTPEIGINALIVSFVVCGMGLTTGLMVLRSLAHRREPMSLFGGPDGVPFQGAMPTEVPAQRNECPPEVIIKNTSRVHSDAEIAPVMRSHGSESIATHKTHDSGGIIAAIATIGMGSLLMGFSWQFLFLAVLAGGLVALVLYWVRNGQGSSISGYMAPVAGGVVGSAALIGLGVVMMRFHFLRDFLSLAVGAGSVIALVLYWVHRREENSRGSFL
jgi:hypothetical protein